MSNFTFPTTDWPDPLRHRPESDSGPGSQVVKIAATR